MSKVYVVMGNNGERYEDYQDWPVCAYLDEKEAKARLSRCKICQVKAEEAYKKATDDWIQDITSRVPSPSDFVNSADAGHEFEYDAHFWIEEIPLIRSVQDG